MIDLALDATIFVDDPIREALQEIDILFNTEQTELLGYSEYGTNWEQYLWQMSPSPHSLKSYIKEKIANETYYPNMFDITIDVKILEGEFRNIYQVLIVLRESATSKTADGFRIYQLR